MCKILPVKQLKSHILFLLSLSQKFIGILTHSIVIRFSFQSCCVILRFIFIFVGFVMEKRCNNRHSYDSTFFVFSTAIKLLKPRLLYCLFLCVFRSAQNIKYTILRDLASRHIPKVCWFEVTIFSFSIVQLVFHFL